MGGRHCDLLGDLIIAIAAFRIAHHNDRVIGDLQNAADDLGRILMEAGLYPDRAERVVTDKLDGVLHVLLAVGERGADE